LVNPKQYHRRPVLNGMGRFILGRKPACFRRCCDLWIIISSMMSKLDPEEEQQRLAQHYAAMSDGELEKLDERAHSLTEAARQALERELDRRELAPRAETPQPPADELTVRELVSIRKFRDLPEALLAKGMLESAGIECFLADDNMVRMDWFISNFIGGIKLQVIPGEAEAAIELLDQPIPEGFDVEGLGDYQQPRCPKCQSLDISFEGWTRQLPIPAHG
jgi:hypothetical protein